MSFLRVPSSLRVPSIPRRLSMPRLLRAGLLVPLLAGLLLTACSSPAATPPAATTGSAQLTVAAAFYPLAYAAQRAGGDRVRVLDLTKPGAEPHDLELTPKDLADLSTARFLVYLRGFQPAIDEAAAQLQSPDHSAAPGAGTLEVRSVLADLGEDPHFWLDPTQYATVVTAIGRRLAVADPAGAATYTANAEAFVAELTALDQEFAAGLASCRSTVVVTSHEAFGHLTARYGLTQVGIAGLTPDQEPSAAKLAEVAAVVRANGVTTIYAETLVDPRFAQTVATSTGATVAVLDPVEGITSSSAGTTYLEIMRANLASLRQGQVCP